MRIYFDGGCKPNPGNMEIGLVFVADDGSKAEHAEYLGYGTNNQAEWLALIVGVAKAKEMGLTEIKMIGDSKNVCMQASGAWKMKKSSVLYDFWAAYVDAAEGMEVCFEHVLRHKNLAGIMLEGK